MAIWLVMQGQSFTQARKGNYLWAPLYGKEGKSPPFYWSNMANVQQGELILSYVKKKINAVAAANGPAVEAERPQEWNSGNYVNVGRRISVTYTDLLSPINLDLPTELVAVAQTQYGILDKNGDPNQGYLFELNPRVGQFLIEKVGIGDSARISETVATTANSETEAIALAKSRRGQGKFRDCLLDLWDRRCCVSGFDEPSLLRASHIKPWSISDNAERLDPYNGFLLNPTLDALFDSGFCTFDDNGVLRTSCKLTDSQCEALGLGADLRIKQLKPEHLKFLAYHREKVFLDA